MKVLCVWTVWLINLWRRSNLYPNDTDMLLHIVKHKKVLAEEYDATKVGKKSPSNFNDVLRICFVF